MIINNDSPTPKSSLYIIYDVGSQVETEGYYGHSHGNEHISFGGVSDIETGTVNDMMDMFDEKGVMCNAFTANNMVCYMIEFLSDELEEEYLYDFANRIVNNIPTEEEFEKEKPILLSELQMSFGDRDSQMQLNFDKVFYDIPIYNPIGKAEDIMNLGYEDFLSFRDKYYSKPSKVILTSDKYTLDESKLRFEFADPKEIEKDIQKVSKVNDTPSDVEVDIFQDYTDTDNCTMLIINKDIIEEDFPKIDFVNSLIASGLNAPLYNVLREQKGLCYHLGLDLMPLNSKQAINQFYIDTDYANIQEAEDGFFETMENMKEYITEEMIERRRKKSIIQEKKIAIDLYAMPYYGLYDEWDSKDFLETITVEEVHNLIDKYYLDCEWVTVTDKDLY